MAQHVSSILLVAWDFLHPQCDNAMPWESHGQEPNGKSKGKGRGKQRDEDDGAEVSGGDFLDDLFLWVKPIVPSGNFT